MVTIKTQQNLIEGTYLSSGPSKENFWILEGFLTDDVSSYSIPFYREFLNDPNQIKTGGNYSVIEKEGDDVLIGCEFEPILFEPCIQMPQKELLSILDQWEALVKLRPAEIIIFKKNDSYILEGRNLVA
ncbi:MAG TPA: hypothetical protein VGT41_02900 [Candidatus Babeliales bacterium]|nr:hypothetical protein [Candidatus Babeliales bacterium]